MTFKKSVLILLHRNSIWQCTFFCWGNSKTEELQYSVVSRTALTSSWSCSCVYEMGGWCDEPCPVCRGKLYGLKACQDLAASCSCSVYCSRESPVMTLPETNTVHHIEAAHEAWQWEASSVKASSGSPRRDPSFALSCFTAGSAISSKTSLKGSWKNLPVNIKAEASA